MLLKVVRNNLVIPLVLLVFLALFSILLILLVRLIATDQPETDSSTTAVKIVLVGTDRGLIVPPAVL